MSTLSHLRFYFYVCLNAVTLYIPSVEMHSPLYILLKLKNESWEAGLKTKLISLPPVVYARRLLPGYRIPELLSTWNRSDELIDYSTIDSCVTLTAYYFRRRSTSLFIPRKKSLARC